MKERVEDKIQWILLAVYQAGAQGTSISEASETATQKIRQLFPEPKGEMAVLMDVGEPAGKAGFGGLSNREYNIARVVAQAQLEKDEAKMRGLQVDIESLSHAQEVLTKKLDDVDLAIEQEGQEGWREGVNYSNERFKHKDAYKVGKAEARQGKGRNLMVTIEAMYPELRQAYWEGKEWQALKDSYKEKKK